MLKDDLFTIQEITHDGHMVQATIALNAAHRIFEGHFPEHPVLPGVCTMQIIREITETVLGKKLQLLKGANIKFISLIVPTVAPVVGVHLSYKITEEKISVTASATANEVVCFKFMGSYKG